MAMVDVDGSSHLSADAQPKLVGLVWGLVATRSSVCIHQTDWVVVLRPTPCKIGLFRDVCQANLLAWYLKTKPNTTKSHIHQSKEMYNTKYTQKLKPGLVASYHIGPGNGEGLFWFQHFISLSLTYLDTYPLNYSPGPTWGTFIR